MSGLEPCLTNPYQLVSLTSPYQNYKKYNKKILELINDFHILTSIVSTIPKLYFHITIGAAMEEQYNLEHINYENQFKQLFPDSFYSILESGYEIIHYIISPNKSFDDEYFEEPLFIKYTEHFKWIKTDNMYKSSVLNITVKIFYTMMPTNDFYNNVRIENYRKKGIEHLDKFIQTREDKLFVSSFYLSLKQLIHKINLNNGLVCCYNFAIFKALNYSEKLNNYGLFMELVDCFNDPTKNILCKWITFDEKHYLMISIDKRLITYNEEITYDKHKLLIKNNLFCVI